MLAREEAAELAELMDMELGDRVSPAGDARWGSASACATATGGGAGLRLQPLPTPPRGPRPARRDAGPPSLRRDAGPGRTGVSTITGAPKTPMTSAPTRPGPTARPTRAPAEGKVSVRAVKEGRCEELIRVARGAVAFLRSTGYAPAATASAGHFTCSAFQTAGSERMPGKKDTPRGIPSRPARSLACSSKGSTWNKLPIPRRHCHVQSARC